jgi:hypothetical protein
MHTMTENLRGDTAPENRSLPPFALPPESDPDGIETNHGAAWRKHTTELAAWIELFAIRHHAHRAHEAALSGDGSIVVRREPLGPPGLDDRTSDPGPRGHRARSPGSPRPGRSGHGTVRASQPDVTADHHAQRRRAAPERPQWRPRCP